MLAGAVVATAGCKSSSQGNTRANGGGAGFVPSNRIPAGGVAPAANALTAARPAKLNPDAGGNLFSAMNCDGCHGGGAVGWVGPSLVDGRWRYGGEDEQIFTSIFYGRPKGMPAYGGVIGTDGVWMLVSYIKSQAVPPVVPTTSWLPGGNATSAPPTTAPPPTEPEAEEKASPSPTERAEASGKQASGKEASLKPEEMPAKYGCTACHAVDHKVVGPAFKDVAARYKGQDVEARLVDKVKYGGAGVWGQIPMTPNPQVPDSNLHAVVKWILSLK
jgi:cytochrome c